MSVKTHVMLFVFDEHFPNHGCMQVVVVVPVSCLFFNRIAFCFLTRMMEGRRFRLQASSESKYVPVSMTIL